MLHIACCNLQKHEASNDVGKISKGEGEVMDVTSLSSGRPEENIGLVSAVKVKSVVDTNGENLPADIVAAKPEDQVREKHDTHGSSSPVKRKQMSDSETEDSGSPEKKPRGESLELSSDEMHANDSKRMSDEDLDSSAKRSPKKHKPRTKVQHYAADDDELERMYYIHCVPSPSVKKNIYVIYVY